MNLKDVIDNQSNLSGTDTALLKAVFEKLEAEQTILYNNVKNEICELGTKLNSLQNIGYPFKWQIVTALVDEEKLDNFSSNTYTPIIDVNVFHENFVWGDEKVGINECEENAVVERKRKSILSLPVPMLSNGFYYAGIGFLNCPLKDIDKYCNNIYTARVIDNEQVFTVRYHLQRWNGFIEFRERLLELAANQLNVEDKMHPDKVFPRLFNPWSRRSVLVKVDFDEAGILPNSETHINFRLAENGLQGVLLQGKKLIWNVKCKDDIRLKSCTDKRVVPLFNKNNGVLQIFDCNCMENEFLYLEPDLYKQAEVRQDRNKIYIGMEDNSLLSELYYGKLMVFRPEWPVGVEKRFSNISDDNMNVPFMVQRIRSLADVKEVVETYAGHLLDYVTCNTEKASLGNVTEALEYSQDFCYSYPDYQHLTARSACYLKFKRKDDDIFFEDKITYLLSFMRYAYPEFAWKGVY